MSFDHSTAPSHHNRIAMLTGKINGFGDLMFASRLARYLAADETLRGIEIDFIATADDFQALKSIELDKELSYREVKISDVNTDRRYAAVLVCPGILKLSQHSEALISNAHNVMLITEYELYETKLMELRFNITDLIKPRYELDSKFTLIKSGISRGCQGILLEPDLLPESGEDSYLAKDSDWDKLPPSYLKQQLLGNDQGDISEYKAETRLLSLAYCSYCLPNNVPVVHGLFSMNDKSRNHDLIIVATQQYSTIKDTYQQVLQYLVAFKNLKTAVLINIDDPTEQPIHIENSKANDKSEGEFRIFYCKSLPYKTMIALQKISGMRPEAGKTDQVLTTVTGDQSLTEAISKGGIFSYLFIGASHKRDLYKSLINFALENQFENCAKIIGGHEKKDSITTVDKQALKREFGSLSKIIRTEYNLGQVISGKLKRIFNRLRPLTYQGYGSSTPQPARSTDFPQTYLSYPQPLVPPGSSSPTPSSSSGSTSTLPSSASAQSSFSSWPPPSPNSALSPGSGSPLLSPQPPLPSPPPPIQRSESMQSIEEADEIEEPPSQSLPSSNDSTVQTSMDHASTTRDNDEKAAEASDGAGNQQTNFFGARQYSEPLVETLPPPKKVNKKHG